MLEAMALFFVLCDDHVSDADVRLLGQQGGDCDFRDPSL